MKSNLRSSNTAQRFLRQPLALAVAAAFAACIAAPAQAVVLFNVVDLGMQGDTSSSAQGVNATGQVAGYAIKNPGSVAFSWQGGSRTVLGSLGGTVNRAWGINDNGAVVGISSLAGNAASHAVLWQNGGRTDLGTLGGSHSAAHGINNAGQIVGWAHNANGDPRAFLWRNGQMAELRTLGGSQGIARAINDSGMVAGYSWTVGNASQHATLWKNGSTIDLGTLGGSFSDAFGINSSGAVTGSSHVVGSSASHAVLWRNGGLVDLGTLGGKDSAGHAINDSGQVVGASDMLDGSSHGFIWSATGMKDLNAFLSPGSGATVLDTSSINDNGQIAGRATIGGVSHAVLLNPTGSVNWSNTRGGSFADGSAWDSGLGFAPTKFLDAVIAPAASQTIVVGSDATAKSLLLGATSGGGPTLQLQNGATLNLLRGSLSIQATGTLTGDGSINASVRNFGTVKADNLTILGGFDNHGSITGSGRINATLANHAGATVEVNAGEHLRIAGLGHANAGMVQLLGNGNQSAALTIDGSFDNNGTGRVFLQDANVRFNGGLSNSGLVGVSHGNNNVNGAVDNLAGGHIVLSGNSSTTFYNDVTNNGELRVSNGSTAVFFGLVKGAGTYTGTGTSYYEGGFHVGNSPAVVTLNNATVFDAGSLLDMDIGGVTPGACDDCHAKLVFNGSVAFLGGELKLNWWNGFSAQAGDRFDLFDFNAEHSGNFALFDLPTLTNGLQWDLSQLYASGEISVTGAVPEPETYALMLGGLGLLALRRRHAARQTRGHVAGALEI